MSKLSKRLVATAVAAASMSLCAHAEPARGAPSQVKNVVLVHGGSVITEAGIHAKLVGLVYVAALAPDAGETTAQQYQGFAPTPEFVIDAHPDGFGFVSLPTFKAGFAHDAADDEAAFMRDSQVPINLAAFSTPLKQAAWRTKPSWAVIALKTRLSIRPCCCTWRRESGRM